MYTCTCTCTCTCTYEVNKEHSSCLNLVLHGLLFVADPGRLTLHDLMKEDHHHNYVGACSANCQVLWRLTSYLSAIAGTRGPADTKWWVLIRTTHNPWTQTFMSFSSSLVRLMISSVVMRNTSSSTASYGEKEGGVGSGEYGSVGGYARGPCVPLHPAISTCPPTAPFFLHATSRFQNCTQVRDPGTRRPGMSPVSQENLSSGHSVAATVFPRKFGRALK